MFAQFLDIVFRSLKLDRNLYKDQRYCGEAAIYFAGLIMILDGVAGAFAANTIVKTSIGISGLTAILTWLVWSIFIYVIGVKIFSDKESKIPFKKVLIAVGYAHAPGLIRFFAVTPDLVLPIIFLTQFWIFASLIISTTLDDVKVSVAAIFDGIRTRCCSLITAPVSAPDAEQEQREELENSS